MSGAALSDYGVVVLEERRRLLGALVQRLTGQQHDTDPHREMLEASLAVVEHHQFADVSPGVVDELLDRLGDRLGEHAQFGKQRALQLLRGRLLEIPVESSQYDFQHRLLAFLYASARAPLSNHYSGCAFVDSLEAQARNAVVGPPTHLSDTGSEGSWVELSGLYSPGSQLSEWSDAEEEGAPPEAMSEDGAAPAAAAAALPAPEAAVPAAAQAESSPVHAPDTAAAAAAAMAEQAAGSLAKLFPAEVRHGPRRETPYTRNSLSVWLASKQSGGQPARVLQPALCFHERELVQQVLHMLKGVASPGPAFQLDPVRDAYHPRPGVHLHCSSLGSARAVLARFARCATALRRVQAFCDAVARGGRPAGELPGQPRGVAPGRAAESVSLHAQQQPHSRRQQQQQHQSEDQPQKDGGLPHPDAEEQRLLVLPTVAAFAAAVAEEEQALQQQVLVLEVACTTGALGSLLQLQQRTASLAEHAELLAALARRCCAWRGSAADSATGLLSTLHDALQQHLLLARSQGGLLASMLLRIFAASCRPLLLTLHKWLYRGLLEDPFEEFFVMKAPGPEIPTDSPRFWSEAFILRPARPDGRDGPAAAAATANAAVPPAAPCFLAAQTERILAAGKSMLLLQAYSSWRLAAAGAAHMATPEVPASQHLAVTSGAAAGDEGPPSPAKRRLSELGALGFALAADPGQQQQLGHGQHTHGAAGGHSMTQTTAAGRGGVWLQGHSSQVESDSMDLEPPQLHQQLLEGLQVQLEEKLTVAKRQQQQQLLEASQLEAAAANGDAGGSSGSDRSIQGSGRIFCGDWQQPATACGDHALLLPEQDTLPPLPQLPPTPDGLPAASVATIAPSAAEEVDAQEPDTAAASPSCAGGTGGNQGSGNRCSGSAFQWPTIAERMRRAAGARASQTAGAAAEQLPLLMIPLEPVGACLEAAPDRAERAVDSSATAMQQAEAEQGPGSEPSAVAVQFDSSSWQGWYQRTAAALSQQLHVLDCLGPAASGAGGRSCASSSDSKGLCGRRQQPPTGSFGAPLGLQTSASGSACDQIWGRSSGAGELGGGNAGSNRAGRAHGSSDAAARQRRQQPRLAAEAPPLGVLLQRSLLQAVQAQVDVAGSTLCAVLLRRGLLRQLASMQELYLLGSSLLEPFVAFLLRRISTASGGLDRVSEFELNAALQDSLAAGTAGTAGRAGRALRATAHILPPPPEAQQVPQAIPQRVHALARLHLRLEPGWPLSLLVGEEMLAQYNRVLVLLLQLRWVKQSLQSVRYQGWKAGRRASLNPMARYGLQHQMVHLVDSVLQYMTDRVVAAGSWLEQAVSVSASLEEMHRCRAKYLRAVTRYCLLSNEGVARLVHEGLLHLLNACLQYCSLRRQQDAVTAALAHLAAQQQRQQQDGSGLGPGVNSEEDTEEEAQTAGGAEGQLPAAPAGLQWAGRRAELAKRSGELRAALGALRRDWSNRQRLLLRVLAAKAAEAGSHADELRQLLGALDFSRHYEASLA